MATDFEDWCKQQPNNSIFLEGTDALCTEFSSQYSDCQQKFSPVGGEKYFTYYYHYISTKKMVAVPGPGSQYERDAYPVVWKDPSGSNCGSAIGCYYDCNQNNSIICVGGRLGVTSRFTNNVERYWGTPYIPPGEIDFATTFDNEGNVTPFTNLGIAGIDNPYPYEGFIYDYYAVVGQGPAMLGSIFQFICEYCYGGLVPPCVDRYFTWRGFASQVYTFDSKLGIPYKVGAKLEKFYNDNSLDSFDIKYNHLADEQVFVTGSANWNLGDIKYQNTKLYGDFLNRDGVDYEVNNGKRIATITNGDGNQKYVIADISLNRDFEFTDISVLNKNCSSRKNIENYPWIYVDIPESMELEYEQAYFTEIFPIAIEDMLTRFIYGSSVEYDFFGVAKSFPVIGASFHYRKYCKKIIKAPHNLYVKAGEFTFRECAFGQTLSLEPGRYFFPNMCYCSNNNRSLGPANLLKIYKGDSYSRVENEPDFITKYNSFLIQFIDLNTNDESLEARFKNAVSVLGFPGSKNTRAARMEEDAIFSKFKTLEEYMQEVRGILDFIKSATDENGKINQSQGDINLLLPSDSANYTDNLPDGGGPIVIENPVLD